MPTGLSDRGILHSNETVTATATELAGAKARRTLLTFANLGAEDIYLGGPGVTSTSFLYQLAVGEWVQFSKEGDDGSPTMQWYGVTASGSSSVSVGESVT